MRKIILLALMALFSVCSMFSQVQKNAIDTMQCNESKIIVERLQAFRNANSTSHFLMFTGAALALTGSLIKKPIMINNVNALTVGGSALAFVGVLVSMDSFRFLNFKGSNPVEKGKYDLY